SMLAFLKSLELIIYNPPSQDLRTNPPRCQAFPWRDTIVRDHESLGDHGCTSDEGCLPGRTSLDNSPCGWHQNPVTKRQPVSPHETILAQALHVVEQPDLRHAVVDLAVRRARRR